MKKINLTINVIQVLLASLGMLALCWWSFANGGNTAIILNAIYFTGFAIYNPNSSISSITFSFNNGGKICLKF